jgi:hypothetical protein
VTVTQLLALGGVILLAAMSPGPDFVIVTRNAMLSGRRAGTACAAGIAMGVFTWALVTALGIAGLLAASAVDAQHVHQELGELVRLRHDRRQRAREGVPAPLRARPLTHARVQLPHHRPARPGRCHDRLVVAEDIGELPRQRLRLVPVARVVVRLSAAGLDFKLLKIV